MLEGWDGVVVITGGEENAGVGTTIGTSVIGGRGENAGGGMGTGGIWCGSCEQLLLMLLQRPFIQIKLRQVRERRQREQSPKMRAEEKVGMRSRRKQKRIERLGKRGCMTMWIMVVVRGDGRCFGGLEGKREVYIREKWGIEQGVSVLASPRRDNLTEGFVLHFNATGLNLLLLDLVRLVCIMREQMQLTKQFMSSGTAEIEQR